VSIFGKIQAWLRGEEYVERDEEEGEVDAGAVLDRDADMKADFRLGLGHADYTADQDKPEPPR
jgi:hypothetical protein